MGHLPGVALRPGTGADHHEAAVAADLPAGENGPVTVLGDAAYGTGQARRALTDAGHTTALGRLQPNGARIAQFKKPCTPCPLHHLGTIKNNAWLHTRAAALNLRALINLGLTHPNDTWALAPAPA